MDPLNSRIAARLEEVAGLLEDQGANVFRVEAWRRAAWTVRNLNRPVSKILDTALFSNTARAHALGRTHDWVVLYADGALGDRQWTVVTDLSGDLRGQRVVRGRERECLEHYRAGSGSRPERLALTAPGGDWRQR
jgi:Helix-hairpin-helix domain